MIIGYDTGDIAGTTLSILVPWTETIYLSLSVA